MFEDKTFVGTAPSGWVNDEEARERERYAEGSYSAIAAEARKGRDVSIADVVDTTSIWTSHLDNYLKAIQWEDIATMYTDT